MSPYHAAPFVVQLMNILIYHDQMVAVAISYYAQWHQVSFVCKQLSIISIHQIDGHFMLFNLVAVRITL